VGVVVTGDPHRGQLPEAPVVHGDPELGGEPPGVSAVVAQVPGEGADDDRVRQDDQPGRAGQVFGGNQSQVLHGEGQRRADHHVAHLRGQHVQIGLGQVPGLICHDDADGLLPAGGEASRVAQPAE
jgi:hypothetical protein